MKTNWNINIYVCITDSDDQATSDINLVGNTIGVDQWSDKYDYFARWKHGYVLLLPARGRQCSTDWAICYALPRIPDFFLFFFFVFIFFNDFSDNNYLRIRWTNFYNLFTKWKRFGGRWSIWTSFSISQGRCQVNRFCEKNGKLPTFVTLAFRNEMGYRYLSVHINSVNNASISCKNFVNFGKVTLALAELICKRVVRQGQKNWHIYIVKYLQIYWTDVRNPFTIWKHFGCRCWSVPYSPICHLFGCRFVCIRKIISVEVHVVSTWRIRLNIQHASVNCHINFSLSRSCTLCNAAFCQNL